MNRVSIIMGIYNCQKTLPEAVDSILNQSYKDWILIMCDDGSEDSTYRIAEEYCRKYPEKIRLMKNTINQGLNKTLNRCLQNADTEYVARMDGDDISLPDRLEKEIAFLDSHPQYDIVSTPMIYFDDNGVYRTGRGGKEPKIESMVTGTPFCHAPCMVRKRAYDTVEGYSERKDRQRVEDWDLWIRMYEKGFKGFILPDPLYKMRDDRNAYSRRKFSYRINEAKVGASAITRLKLQKWRYVLCLRPIIVGLLPAPIYMYLHKKQV